MLLLLLQLFLLLLLLLLLLVTDTDNQFRDVAKTVEAALAKDDRRLCFFFFFAMSWTFAFEAVFGGFVGVTVGGEDTMLAVDSSAI